MNLSATLVDLSQGPGLPLTLGMALVMAFVHGSVLASFVVAWATRMARGESILRPASHCDACLRPLKWRHMIPIVGHVWLKGKSACCGSPIPKLSVVCEALLGLFFLLLVLRCAHAGLPLAHALVPALLACVLLHLSLMDAMTGRLPDRVLLPAIPLLFLGKWLLLGASPMSMTAYGLLAGLEFALVRLLGERRLKREVLGLGDVKLAILLGTALEETVFFALAVSALAALVHAKAHARRQLFFGPWLCGGAAFFLLL